MTSRLVVVSNRIGDPRKAAELLKEAMRLRKELTARFPEMQQRYRAAHAELTSPAAWEKVFSQTGTEK